MILDDEDIMEENGMTIVLTKRKTKGQKTTSKSPDVIEVVGIARTESKDDGMDCNFVSEDEEQTNTRISNQEGDKEEPIYINACNEVNERNLQRTESRTKDDYSNNNNMYVVILFSFRIFFRHLLYFPFFITFFYSLKTILLIFLQRDEAPDA